MIQQTFTAATQKSLVAEIAQFLRDGGFYVVHDSQIKQNRVSCREVAERYKLKASVLSMRLKRCKFHFPHERGKTKILWLCVTPELHDYLRK